MQNDALRTGKVLGLSAWFDDVYIDETGQYFELNNEYGLISKR